MLKPGGEANEGGQDFFWLFLLNKNYANRTKTEVTGIAGKRVPIEVTCTFLERVDRQGWMLPTGVFCAGDATAVSASSIMRALHGVAFPSGKMRASDRYMVYPHL